MKCCVYLSRPLHLSLAPKSAFVLPVPHCVTVMAVPRGLYTTALRGKGHKFMLHGTGASLGRGPVQSSRLTDVLAWAV